MARSQLEAVLEIVDVRIDAKVFAKISRAVAGLPGGLKKTEAATRGVTTQARKADKAFKDTAKSVNAGARGANLFFKRMAQFAILLPAFSTLNRSLRGSVSFLVDFESSIRKIIALDIGGLADQFDNIAKASLRTAQDFGASALEVVTSTQLFVQAGFDLADAQEKSRAATLGAEISTLNLADAQEVLIAVTKQFGDIAGTDIEIIDKLARVEDLAAAGAKDLADALRTGGNALAFSTKSFEDTIGLIAALREQTRKSGREVGTFFKTLATRISAAGEPRAALEALGIEVQNLDGSLRPLLSVLNDTKATFDTLTEAEQANFAKAVAGVRQFESLLAVLKSLEKANDLSAKASDAGGTSMEKFGQRAETLENRFQKLVATGQELAQAVGDAGLTDFLKDALSLATLLVKALTGVVGALDAVGIGITPLLAVTAAGGLKAAFGGGKAAAGAAGIGGAGGGGDAALKGFNSQLKIGFGALGRQSGAIGASFLAHKASTASVGKFGKTMQFASLSVGRFNSATKGGAGRFAKFTVASLAAGAALNALADNTTGALSTFGDLTAGGVQTGLQLAALNPLLGVLVGSFTILSSSVLGVIDAYKDQELALRDLAENEARTGEIASARGSLLSGDAAAENFVSNMVAGMKDRIKQDVDYAAIFNTSDLKKQLDFGQFKEVLFDPSQVKAFAFGLLNVRKEIFGNQEALERLRDAFDETGNTEDTAAEITGKLNAAFGVLPDKMNAVTGVMNRSLFPTLKAFEKFQSLTGSVEQLVELEASIQRASGSTAFLTEGIDLLANTSEDSSKSLEVARNRFADLNEKFRDLANIFDLSPDDAKKFFKEFEEGIALGPGAFGEAARSDFALAAPEGSRDLIKKVTAARMKLGAAELTAIDDNNALMKDAFEQTRSIREGEIVAAKAAQSSLNDFRVSLLKLGTDAASVEQIAGLSPDQISEIVSGTSDLPKVIQDVIRSGFAGGAEAAQNELAAVAAQTEGSVALLATELQELDDRIAALGTPIENSTDFFKRLELQTERSSKSTQIETEKRSGLIKAANAAIKVADQQKKAMDKLEKAEKKRLDAEDKLLEASIKFERQIRSVAGAFAEFAAGRISDLLEEQADAQGELGDTQKTVIESTKSLSEAQKEFTTSMLQFNGVLTEAKVQANLIARDIDMLTGGLSTFQERLSSLEGAFTDALQDANITLEQRIELEKQLAEETLSFLKNAKSEIVDAGLAIFTQTGSENQKLQEGIAGLGFVADKLGGSLENFFAMSASEFDTLSQELLSLPADFRKNIASALSFLPSTANIGGFSPDQLKEALGQVGAGISPEAGLPSIENLNAQQVAELQKLSALNTQSAQLQVDQLFAAQESLDVAREELDLSKIQQERAQENFEMVSEKIVEETAVLQAAAEIEQQLLNQVIGADDINTTRQIEQRAQLFADQNQKFSEVGDKIVSGIAAAIDQRLAVIEAGAAVSAFGGNIPNYAKGKLTVKEAAGLLQAGAREKRAMPGGAGLAVANTSETIIPHRFRGQIPNFQGGNSPISAGINAVRGINETVVAAISRSVTQALTGLGTDGTDNTEEFQRMIAILQDVKDELQTISTSNASIDASVATDDAAAVPGGTASNVKITVQTNQNSSVQITGLDQLREQLAEAVRDVTLEQVEGVLGPLFEELDGVIQVLRERGLQTSFGQPR